MLFSAAGSLCSVWAVSVQDVPGAQKMVEMPLQGPF